MRAPESDAILARLLDLHPKVIDLSLDRVERLLAALDHPERAVAPVVHIAGTNGKGSVTAMLRAGLEGGGARVQAYTSPHLVRFHERIRLADGLIPEPDLAALLAECEAANAGAPITFFEITTAAAFLAFARERADWLLLEVGLGGRLDATNVVERPALTVITPVSYDHQQYLGDTLTEIAGEKAGILKPGVPAILGRQDPEAEAAIRARAEAVGAPLRVWERDWSIRRAGDAIVFEMGGRTERLPLPSLPGAHQVENAGIALAAVFELGVGDPAQALAKAIWPARMQRLTRGPLAQILPAGSELWLDGGHNPAAGQALAKHLAGLSPTRPLWLVVGMLETKAVGAFLAPLAPLVTGLVAVPVPDTPAALPPERLAEVARATALHATVADSPKAALASIAGEGPARIMICGSLYLAGAVLRENG